MIRGRIGAGGLGMVLGMDREDEVLQIWRGNDVEATRDRGKSDAMKKRGCKNS